jgi:hypothetical protein
VQEEEEDGGGGEDAVGRGSHGRFGGGDWGVIESGGEEDDEAE